MPKFDALTISPRGLHPPNPLIILSYQVLFIAKLYSIEILTKKIWIFAIQR